MTKAPYVQLAAMRLRQGVDERTLIEASDAFERDFVRKQSGVVKRVLLRNEDGSYADLVFFESKDAAARVAAAEMSSEACQRLFALMEPPDAPEMGVLSFEHLKTYEPALA